MSKKNHVAVCMGIGLAAPVLWVMGCALLWPQWEDANTFPDTPKERFHALFYLVWSAAILVLGFWPEPGDKD